MNLENIIYAAIAAIIGAGATIVTTLIKQKKSEGRVNEEKIKLNIEKIVNELNVDNVHFYILNENKNFSTEKDMKFKFKSKGAGMGSHILNSVYKITGKSGAIGVLIIAGRRDCPSEYIESLSTQF